MTADDDTSRGSPSIEAWTQRRDGDERRARLLGEELRDAIDRDCWPDLTIEARRARVEAARRLMHKRLGLVRETLLQWNDSDDPGLGYDEKTGGIHLPHHQARR